MVTVNLDWLARAMHRKKIQTAAQLSRFAGISKPTASNIIAGKPLGTRVDMVMLTSLASAFGVKNPLTLLEFTPDE